MICKKKNLKESDVMDRHFLEFWGNLFINTAKQQKQMEDLAKWMQQGFKGFDELTAMFNKFYGLENLKKDTPAYMESWEAASENFLNSFKKYLDLMGMVPKNEHLALAKKYEELKKKVADQEETINHLRMLLQERKAESQDELVQGFHDLIDKQSKQFQETMETFGSFFKKENNP
jgi:chromosome segregation ATPase